MYKPVGDLSEHDFMKHPVWTWVESLDREDLVQPVYNFKPLPESEDSLFIAARFELANGVFGTGDISVDCESRKVYAANIYMRKELFLISLNAQDIFESAILKMEKFLKIKRSEILPIKYETDQFFKDSPPICGRIDVFNRSVNKNL